MLGKKSLSQFNETYIDDREMRYLTEGHILKSDIANGKDDASPRAEG